MSQPQSDNDPHDDGMAKLSSLRQKLDPEDREELLHMNER